MARRKRPGVVLLPPEQNGSGTWWRARYVDPDSRKQVRRTLDRTLRTQAQREDYAVKLAERLARRRLELENGGVRATGTTLREAEGRFYASLVKKRERTRETYHEGTDRFLRWAEKNGIQTCDDLTRGQVIAFRESLLVEDVSAHTFNKHLRAVKRMWGYWIDADLCPKLDYADLKRVKQEDAPTELREFLTPAKVRTLLKAAERHDSQTFRMTRDEKAEGRKGETARYAAISGFTLFVLLTGVRLSEALALTWADVDLESLDHSGRPVGQFQIRGADSKTRKPRTVKLGVSPMLRRLLIAQKLRTGGRDRVWPDMTADTAKDSMHRLRTFGAPSTFTWQALRRTCSTYLVNSSIFGGASAYLAAKQLGHGVTVMEKNYSGLVDGIDPSLRTLESVLGIEEHAARIVRAVSEAPKPMRVAVPT